jgi:hypothetical protein
VAGSDRLYQMGSNMALAQRTLAQHVRSVKLAANAEGVSLTQRSGAPRSVQDHMALGHALALRTRGVHPEKTESSRINSVFLERTPRKRNTSQVLSEPFTPRKVRTISPTSPKGLGSPARCPKTLRSLDFRWSKWFAVVVLLLLPQRQPVRSPPHALLVQQQPGFVTTPRRQFRGRRVLWWQRRDLWRWRATDLD